MAVGLFDFDLLCSTIDGQDNVDAEAELYDNITYNQLR